jgi:hypothetical protein
LRWSELGQDAPHRLVLVVVVLELLQRGHSVFQRPLVMPMVNMMKKVQAALLDDHAVLGQVLGDDGGRDAGLAELAVQRQARVDDGGLDRVQHVEARPGCRSRASVLGLEIQSSRSPMPSSASSSGPQTLNHQSLPNSWSTLRMARRKSSASRMLSSTSAVPPGASIMAAATSQEAMIEYCGEVEVCIR